MTQNRPTLGPLFGEVAMELGIAKTSDILDAICEQMERRGSDERTPRIGEILVARGVLPPEDVSRILAEMEKRSWAIELPGHHSLSHMATDDTALVFRGVERMTEAPVRIRFLRFRLAEQPEALGRFRRESRALAKLDHPNILRVLDHGDLEGFPYLVLEHVLAPTLGAVLRKSGRLLEPRALAVAQGIAKGLDYAHGMGVVHGALRPGSVLLSRLAGPKVTNFRGFGPDEVLAAGTTGSPHYGSPRTAGSDQVPEPEDDLYSLGAVLYHLLTGWPPFLGTHREIVEQHRRRSPQNPRDHVPGLSPAAASLVMDLLAKDPADRPAGMAEVAERAAATPVPVPVGPEAGRRRSLAWWRR